MNEIQSITNRTNYSYQDLQHAKKTELLILIFFLSIIIILLLLCYFINGMTEELNQLTTQILHYNYHNYGCCQFYN